MEHTNDIPDAPDLSSIHVPVMLERTLELLAPALERPDAVLVDATLGMGGHALAVLDRFPGLELVGIDRDQDALGIAAARLARFADRIHLVHAVYDDIETVLDGLGLRDVAGILFDLGVSSLQLDRTERGFSYSKDAPLDMRMDASTPVTAEQILAEYSESELRRIFTKYGEEKLAGRYAKHIVAAREQNRLVTSAQLVALLDSATPAAVRRAGHPAKRVFQALRIEVNRELAVLERAIPSAIDRLSVGGRIVVLSYQSLEDRIVKHALAEGATSTAPRGLPVELPEHRPVLKLLVRGAERATDEDISTNPRSAPVRLRAAERIRRAA
ncbi:16S rRNA (cytosine1402-N4)-methyltransferase [Cryobacterium mesophilum]|uniref:Ribosomal RNA small subunit methyltransferase H n=1 Tax=Terrimesophilobacter mesophilus TaxID=433647 RepID=A0A4R8V9C8_9MICO|nr:16S rRNA (cytosine(1402)-N(4))-methyltransferase RsmH [Terrimesophilobacter mesophilus]MBB5632052.1 16S rRNA (cytosine1402-N4)-methyltransferase [Terrimesophilobacter mesophilus]TFB78936.1 16S rRNA (cytosine(1402)-N(4))-methyltransferase RsmH [Terrimesophilobacter mesophilus]